MPKSQTFRLFRVKNYSVKSLKEEDREEGEDDSMSIGSNEGQDNEQGANAWNFISAPPISSQQLTLTTLMQLGQIQR